MYNLNLHHKKPSLGSFFQAVFGKLQEFVRDFTGLGNPLVLASLGLILFGWSKNYGTLVLLWIGNEIFCSGIKLYFFTSRPEPMRYDNWLSKIEAGSFPSIHASRWAVFAAFALTQSSIASLTVFVLAILALIVGWTRVMLKKHYWRDVLAGWVIGFVIAWVVGNLV